MGEFYEEFEAVIRVQLATLSDETVGLYWILKEEDIFSFLELAKMRRSLYRMQPWKAYSIIITSSGNNNNINTNEGVPQYYGDIPLDDLIRSPYYGDIDPPSYRANSKSNGSRNSNRHHHSSARSSSKNKKRSGGSGAGGGGGGGSSKQRPRKGGSSNKNSARSKNKSTNATSVVGESIVESKVSESFLSSNLEASSDVGGPVVVRPQPPSISGSNTVAISIFPSFRFDQETEQ